MKTLVQGHSHTQSLRLKVGALNKCTRMFTKYQETAETVYDLQLKTINTSLYSNLLHKDYMED